MSRIQYRFMYYKTRYFDLKPVRHNDEQLPETKTDYIN